MKPFQSSKILIARADKHLDEFALLLKSYVDSSSVRRGFDHDNGKVVFKIHFKDDPPLELSVIAFDAINRLRSSLDHAVFDASRMVGGNPKPKYTKFPHGITKSDAENDLPRKRSEVPDVIRPLLLAFEPYKGGKNDLWEMNELRNGKIHRLLVPSAITHEGIEPSGKNITIYFDVVREWNPLTRELICARFHFISEGTCINVPASVEFDGYRFSNYRDAIKVLRDYREVADSIVLGLEANAARIVAETPQGVF